MASTRAVRSRACEAVTSGAAWLPKSQSAPLMRILVAVEPQDFRRGIERMARVCKATLASDPFSGMACVARDGRGTSIKILVYDGQGLIGASEAPSGAPESKSPECLHGAVDGHQVSGKFGPRGRGGSGAEGSADVHQRCGDGLWGGSWRRRSPVELVAITSPRGGGRKT